MEQQSCKSINLQVYRHQVSGKTSKFTDNLQKFIYKPYSEKEGILYQELQTHHIGHSSYQLSKFIPKYFGVFTLSQIFHQQDSLNSPHKNSTAPNQNLKSIKEIAEQELPSAITSPKRKKWIQHINSRTEYDRNQKFIKLQNLTYSFRYPNIMDLKLGIKTGKKQSKKRKIEQTTTISHWFRINGLSVRQFDNQKKANEVFLSKYYCQKITQTELNRHLAFFMFDGSKIHIQLLDNFIERLKEMILGFMSFRGIKFESSSLYMAFDAYDPSKYTINLIDFDKYYEGEGVDESVERGLKSSLRHLIEIRESVQTVQSQLSNKEMMYFREDHEVIPQFKIQHYQHMNKNSLKKPVKASSHA